MSQSPWVVPEPSLDRPQAVAPHDADLRLELEHGGLVEVVIAPEEAALDGSERT